MTINRIKTLLLFSSLFFASSAYANWYQVEVIVFEYLTPVTDGESWYVNPLLAPLTNSVELVEESDIDVDNNDPVTGIDPGTDETGLNETGLNETGQGTLTAYAVLPGNNHRLAGIYQVLRLSRDYRPVYHIAWQQPALDADQARAVHIQAGTEGGDTPANLQFPVESTRGEDGLYRSLNFLFDGTIRIRSSLYLHVDVDMAYFRTPAVSSLVDGSSGTDIGHAAYVGIRESRRIKLNELHYFDHPMFGIILQVSRLDTED